MVIARAQPLLQLPEVFHESLETHVANLFSENDIQRKQAMKWLNQNADPQIISRIGKEVRKHDDLSVKVRRDIHKFLMNSCLRNLGGVGKLSNECILDVKLALCSTLVKARRL
jgi:hypothetical protein